MPVRPHRCSGDSDNIHIAFPDEAIADVAHVRPNRKRRRGYRTTIGDRVVMSVGRGAQVWDTATCPPARNGVVFDAVYDDGLGLNAYEFYCDVKGGDPFAGLNEP